MARDVKAMVEDKKFQEVAKWIERMNTTLGACKVCKGPIGFEPFVMTAYQYSPKSFIHQRPYICFTCTECGCEAARFVLSGISKFFPNLRHEEFLNFVGFLQDLAEEAAAQERTGCGKPDCPDCCPPMPPVPGVH